MYIENLRLQNVKCFEDISLEFRTKEQTGDPQSNWNVILGHNGDGKTTLLQSIAACLMDATTADRLLKPANWIRGVRSGALLSATLRQRADDQGGGRPKDLKLPAREVWYAILRGGMDVPLSFQDGEELRLRYLPTATVVDSSIGIPAGFSTGSVELKRLQEDTEFLRRWAYPDRAHAGWISAGYGAFRRVSGFASETISFTEPLQRRFLTLFEEGAALYDCESWLKELDRRAARSRQQSAERRTLENVKRVILTLLPDVKTIDIKDEVVFRWRSGDVGLGQLSDGYRSMFALAADLLRWLEMLHPRNVALDQCTGVVLIDEIDAHLHPRWQREAGFLLTRVFPNIQFIVTSHSPFVAMAAGEGALTLLEKDVDSVRVRQDVPYVRGWAVDQVLTEIFGLVSLRDPKTTEKLNRYENLRLKRRTEGLTAEEEAELRGLESDLNERLQSEPDSPREKRFEENLAYFAAQIKAKDRRSLMRYVNRGEVPASLGAQLEYLQANVSEETSARQEWERFGRTEDFQQLDHVLRDRFRNKCAYCEAARSLTIDHFWPKSPHPHNDRRGTPLRMYRWDNLLPACRDCQGFECKGAHMAWDAAGNPLLLDPCDPNNDPIGFLQIVIPTGNPAERRGPLLPEGWLEPQEGLDELAVGRATLTIRRLKLNTGRRGADLWEERARTISNLRLLIEALREWGPDRRSADGTALRELFAEAISDRAPYLAGVRQLFYSQPDFTDLRNELLTAMPEIEPMLELWHHCLALIISFATTKSAERSSRRRPTSCICGRRFLPLGALSSFQD